MAEPVYVDKYCESSDILPTLLNLFGVEFDSRLLMGRDILWEGQDFAAFRNCSLFQTTAATTPLRASSHPPKVQRSRLKAMSRIWWSRSGRCTHAPRASSTIITLAKCLDKENHLKMDAEKIKQGVRLLLEGIGEDPGREGLLETPDRIARMYEELAAGYADDANEHLSVRFGVENGGIVLEKDIRFYSMCEHHLLPFYGTAAVAYIPNGEVVGLSKIARTVEVYARRLQLQERMTAQIADAFMRGLNAKGVMVFVEAEHMCMTMRGIKKPGSKTVTTASRGVFETDPALRETFWHMLGR